MAFPGSPASQSLSAFNIGNFYPSAFFDYLSRMMPRRLKALFNWLEYLYVNCGEVYAVIKKFSEYPITTLNFETNDKETQKKITEVMEKHVKLKRVLIMAGLDYFVYGNGFFSIFKPFTRWLLCQRCRTKHNALQHPYQWNHAKFEFEIVCAKCKHKGVAEVKHERLNDVKKLQVIRWDPKQIDLNHNPVSGETEYYYSIPQDIRLRILTRNPDKFLINTMPWEILMAIKDKKVFKFREGQLFHMKNPAPAGINQEWGYPGLLGCLKPYFYTAVLRKGNEAIALERLVPWRVLHPQPTTSSNDPGQFVNLARWRNELQDAIQKWRRDPNMVKLSPIPVGITEIGGNARPLLTHQEVAQATEGIITSMGVPKEFVLGGLTHAGGSVTLRMLENLLFTYTEQITEFGQWVTDTVCVFQGLAKVKLDMVNFKLIDDIQQKQLLAQLWQQGQISATTFLRSMDIDPETERENLLEEKVLAAKLEKEINSKLKKLEESLSNKVDAQLSGNPLQYDPAAVMQVAQQEAQTMLAIPQDQRKARLEQLQMQDPVLLAVVKDQMAQLTRQQRQQGAVAANGGGMGTVTPMYSGGGSPSTPMAGY